MQGATSGAYSSAQGQRPLPGVVVEGYGTRMDVYGSSVFVPPEGWPTDPVTGELVYGQFGPRVAGEGYGEQTAMFFSYGAPLPGAEGASLSSLPPGFFIQQAPQAALPTPPQAEMKIICSAISDGVIADRFGSRGTQKADGIPTLSPSIMVANFPDRTQSYALIMQDPDSVPLVGYEWVHWLTVFNTPLLAENASIAQRSALLQGCNDFGTVGYGGPTPPDKPHEYIITVYALDTRPELHEGYTAEELFSALEGHILAQASIRGTYTP